MKEPRLLCLHSRRVYRFTIFYLLFLILPSNSSSLFKGKIDPSVTSLQYIYKHILFLSLTHVAHSLFLTLFLYSHSRSSSRTLPFLSLPFPLTLQQNSSLLASWRHPQTSRAEPPWVVHPRTRTLVRTRGMRRQESSHNGFIVLVR